MRRLALAGLLFAAVATVARAQEAPPLTLVPLVGLDRSGVLVLSDHPRASEGSIVAYNAGPEPYRARRRLWNQAAAFFFPLGTSPYRLIYGTVESGIEAWGTALTMPP